jgi:peptidoglycan-associated lipoprotein
MLRLRTHILIAAALMMGAAACGGNKPPVAGPTTPAPMPTSSSGGTTGGEQPPPAPPVPSGSPTVTASPGVGVDPLATMSVEDINSPENSPLKPALFAYDSDALDDAARQALSADADVLKKYSDWVITIEGHCDERGTAEYNLALGDRRALAAKTYLESLGVAADRLRTVSYGKEFPFDPGHTEAAWAKNRRAQLMVTAK